MDLKEKIKNHIPQMSSPEDIYELFKILQYPEEWILEPKYQRKIDELDIAKEEKEKINKIYTILSVEGKLPVFLIESKLISSPYIRYITKYFADRHQRLLLIFTQDYKEYQIVLPNYELIEVGKHKLKITRLILDRENPYHTDLDTILNLSIAENEQNWRDVWRKWKEAFDVERVTKKFFNDYSNQFIRLRDIIKKQNINIKEAHEFTHQFLNRIMFIYFIAKKRWLDNNPRFIKWYWGRYKEELRKKNQEKDTFCNRWLKILFLEAFNNKFFYQHWLPEDINKVLQMAPYLNGGLFRQTKFDSLSIIIKDSIFEEVFNFFEKYNFTIREELPLEVEVAVDPQMLGYVYESLANIAEEIYERQDLGIFYTPRVEVDFMCRRSLVEYLCNHLPEVPKENIYHILFDEDKSEIEKYFSKNDLWTKFEEILDNLSVIDPACGSGAFLVGMLLVISELYKTIYKHLQRQMTDFELKKRTIGNILYGVDIMPWAVHSAELRLWLQLMVESDLKIAVLKLSPLLPNLNLKLRIGDSLVQEIGRINFHLRDSGISLTLKKKLSLLKQEKEKFYNNEPTAKFKTGDAIVTEEVRIFREILSERIINLTQEKQGLEIELSKIPAQIDIFGKIDEEKIEKEREKKQKRINEIIQEMIGIEKVRKGLQDPEKKPFVWDIDFAEIFGEKGGFDIVIGNPPYVRQEKISPPNKLKNEISLENKREYKEKLLNSVQAHFPFVKSIDKKSDYYIYFYFHGLSLLNRKGVFCFITSNSWLDVGYGKDLQEFLLKYVPIKAIYDNQTKRSFTHADINTIIVIFGSPLISDKSGSRWLALENSAKFIMFKKPFEEVINTKNLIEIENFKYDEGSLFPRVLKNDYFRLFPIKQEKLLEEGWEYPEETSEEVKKEFKFKLGAGKYSRNKWGGKYLRAPDIFFTILEKGKGKLLRLGDIAEIRRGFTTGANEFFYLEDITDKIKE